MTEDATTPHDDALDRALEETEAAVGHALGAVFDPRAGLEQIKQRIRQAAQLPKPPASEAQSMPPVPGRRAGHNKSPVAPLALKILVAGGLGAGKTTCVGAVSEIKPLRVEEVLIEADRPIDTVGLTTVAMDVGRITIHEELVLYLFGMPGQEHVRSQWDELAAGALGAIVLADARRLEDCFDAVDYFEGRSIPFVIGVNCFDGGARYPAEDIRRALDLAPDIPVILCDTRERDSVKEVLVSVVQHAMTQTAERHQSVTN